MNSSPVFCLRLLGSPAIVGEDGGVLTGRAAQRHRLALLGLLALSPGRGVSRDKLMAYLWPASGTERARNLLNVSVYVIRKALGEGALLSDGDDLRLNPEVIRADEAEFEAALARGEHEAAAGLYQGPFLDGFFLSDAPEFEHWVDQERERLAGAYAKALEALAEAAEGQGDFGRAVEWWKARAAQDPYDSRVALRLMHALDASGNRAGALQHAAVHRRLLQEEFGVEAPPEVGELDEQLRSAPAVRLEPGSERPPPRAPATSPPEPAAQPATGESPASPRPVPAAPEPRRLRPAVRYGVAALLLGAVLFGAIWLVPGRTDTPPAGAPQPSVAVLPLRNLSTDPRDAALADGMTEELIAMLAQTDGLRVIASTSAFSFRNHQLDVRSIADSLDVAHVLEGGVQKSGSLLRVHVRLVDARDGATRWSQTYDRELRDVFAMQDEIARAVAGELGVRLAGANGAPLRRQPTQNVAAYELYLRGSDRTLARGESGESGDLERLEYFRQAVALDSTFAAAWAGLARSYRLYATTGAMSDRERYWALAEEAAQKAVALDDSLAEAHATLGMIRMMPFDFAAAERHLTRALALDPTYVLAHEGLVTLHLWTGRPEQALAHAERMLELDPLSPYAHAEIARALLGNDRCDEALAHLEELAGVRPRLGRAVAIASVCHAHKQRWPEAIAVLRPQEEQPAERNRQSGQLLSGYILARAGRTEEALRIHATLIERWRRGDGGAFPVAVVYAGLGDSDQAFAWLDRAIADRSFYGGSVSPIPMMVMGPLFEDLHRDPRFERLRERLGLQKR